MEEFFPKEKCTIAFSSENLNETHLKWTTYDKELYDVARALKVWKHYLINRDYLVFKS